MSHFLYAAYHDQLFRGQVHHTPYPVQTAEVDALEESLLKAAGMTRPETSPIVHFSRGVDVEIFPLRKALG